MSVSQTIKDYESAVKNHYQNLPNGIPSRIEKSKRKLEELGKQINHDHDEEFTLIKENGLTFLNRLIYNSSADSEKPLINREISIFTHELCSFYISCLQEINEPGRLIIPDAVDYYRGILQKMNCSYLVNQIKGIILKTETNITDNAYLDARGLGNELRSLAYHYRVRDI